MEFLKDYNYTINYHLGEADVTPDALSIKSIKMVAHLGVTQTEFAKQIFELDKEEDSESNKEGKHNSNSSQGIVEFFSQYLIGV